MTDPAQIARSLTKAQREAVLALHGDAYKTWPEGRLTRMMDGLGKHGLLGLRNAGLAVKGPPWRLTSLGLDLFRHLNTASERQGVDKVDWSRQLEAVHEDGRAVAVTLSTRVHNPDEDGHWILDDNSSDRCDGCDAYHASGESWAGSPWRIRNAATPDA